MGSDDVDYLKDKIAVLEDDLEKARADELYAWKMTFIALFLGVGSVLVPWVVYKILMFLK